MRAIFIADAHLRSPNDENYQKLLEFLDRQIGRLDGLFLLGDIFELWIGYRHVAFSSYIPILEKLRALNESGCRIHYVEGNHDFNLGPYFSETLNCRIITEEEIVEWDGQKLWLCHGDLVNKELKGYRLLRAFWRSFPVRILAAVLPPDLVWKFGFWLSDKSGKYKKTTERGFDPFPLVLPYAEGCLKESDAFLCGHFHQPVLHGSSEGTTLILGDCINQYSYAELIDGSFELKTF